MEKERKRFKRPGSDERLADYAMVFELLGRLARFTSEDKVVDGLFEIFHMLCAPRAMAYLPFYNGKPANVMSCGEGAVFPEELPDDYAWTGDGDGFIFRIGAPEDPLGFFSVEGMAFPEYGAHYINLSLNIREVISVAIANARNYQNLLETKENLRKEKEKAEEYLEEILRYRNHLQELVRERTEELVESNAMLLDEIAARKQIEDALRRSEREYRGIVDNAIAGVFKTANGRIYYANNALARMYGYSCAGELVSSGVECPCMDERYSRVFADMLKKDGKIESLEIEIKTRNGKPKPILISATPDPTTDNGALSFVAMDISPLKESEEKLRLVMEELERSNRDLLQFAYIASHDLQEPLRMVESYIKLLERKYSSVLDEKAKRYMDFASSGAERMRRVITDLLEYSRIQTQGRALEPTDSRSVLGQVIESLQVAVKESGAVIKYGPLPVVNADSVQLSRVFQNLIANSIKFRGKEAPMIEIKSVEREDDWLFYVRDNGIGIGPEYREKIFTIFTRIHPGYKGSGIGLASCKRIIERHGGRIWVESEPGRGSVFYFTIPKRHAKGLAA